MIRQDYFIRLIEEFAAALAIMLKKKENERDDSLRELYRQYVGDYTLVRNMSVDELIGYAANEWNDEERIDRLEMVAELLNAPTQKQHWRLKLKKQSVYSIERKTKIAKLHSILHE